MVSERGGEAQTAHQRQLFLDGSNPLGRPSLRTGTVPVIWRNIDCPDSVEYIRDTHPRRPSRLKTLQLLALAATLGGSLLPPQCAAQARFDTIYNFGAYPDAQTPQNLVAGANGALYGASTYGGIYGYGAVFELQPPAASGDAWTETVLYSFAPQNGDGIYPLAGLSMGPNGALYGTTGPYYGYGYVYELQPPGSAGGSWTETVLFRSTTNLAYLTSVVAGPNGEIYGVSGAGFDAGRGFRVDPAHNARRSVDRNRPL
jgi:hypothetical protein